MPWHATGLPATSTTASPLAIDVDHRSILIVAWDRGWYAVEDRCTHAGCRFSEDAEIEGDRIVCDCHGSEFDLTTGQVVRGPARLPVASFPVRVGIDGTLEVEA